MVGSPQAPSLDPSLLLQTGCPLVELHAAWAFVVVDDAGQILASACGPLEHGLHTMYGAEVFAIFMTLRLSGPDPIVRATDCESVVKVWAQGTQGTEADMSGVPYANFLGRNLFSP